MGIWTYPTYATYSRGKEQEPYFYEMGLRCQPTGFAMVLCGIKNSELTQGFFHYPTASDDGSNDVRYILETGELDYKPSSHRDGLGRPSSDSFYQLVKKHKPLPTAFTRGTNWETFEASLYARDIASDGAELEKLFQNGTAQRIENRSPYRYDTKKGSDASGSPIWTDYYPYKFPDGRTAIRIPKLYAFGESNFYLPVMEYKNGKCTGKTTNKIFSSSDYVWIVEQPVLFWRNMLTDRVGTVYGIDGGTQMKDGIQYYYNGDFEKSPRKRCLDMTFDIIIAENLGVSIEIAPMQEEKPSVVDIIKVGEKSSQFAEELLAKDGIIHFDNLQKGSVPCHFLTKRVNTIMAVIDDFEQSAECKEKYAKQVTDLKKEILKQYYTLMNDADLMHKRHSQFVEQIMKIDGVFKYLYFAGVSEMALSHEFKESADMLDVVKATIVDVINGDKVLGKHVKNSSTNIRTVLEDGSTRFY